jgi:hypothetical protein
MDGVWVWIVVYAVGLALLQVLVYRYLWQRGGSPAGEAPRRWHDDPRQRPDRRPGTDSGSGSDGQSGGESRAGADVRSVESPYSGTLHGATPSDARLCPHCGVENEPDTAFSHCWNCAGRLG